MNQWTYDRRRIIKLSQRSIQQSSTSEPVAHEACVTRASDHLGSCSKGNVLQRVAVLEGFVKNMLLLFLTILGRDSFPPFTFSQVWNSLQGLLCT